MILYSRRKIDLFQQNVIVVEDISKQEEADSEKEGYIIVSKGVYEAAVTLKEKFADSTALMERKMSRKAHQEVVDFFAVNVASPINMLAPYLHLAAEDLELPEDIEILCGYLHVMSMSIDFLSYSAVPEEIRKNVEFSKSQLSMYKSSWEDFTTKIKFAEIDEETVTTEFLREFTTTVCEAIIEKVVPTVARELFQMKDVMVPAYASAISTPTQMAAGYSNTTMQNEYIPNNSSIEEPTLNEVSENPWSMLGDLLKDEITAVKEEEEKKEKTKDKEEDKPVELTDEEKKAMQEKSVLDNIISMYGGM